MARRLPMAPVGRLAELARTKTNLNGMQRWGYLAIRADSFGSQVSRATPKGRQAQQVWRPLFGVIEARWETRFGKGVIYAEARVAGGIARG